MRVIIDRFEEELAVIIQLDIPALPVEKGHADLFLQPSYCQAHRGLRDMHFFSRFGYMLQTRHFYKISQLLLFHPFPLPRDAFIVSLADR